MKYSNRKSANALVTSPRLAVTSDQSRLSQLMVEQMALELQRESYWTEPDDEMCENVPIKEQDELPISVEEIVRLAKSSFTF